MSSRRSSSIPIPPRTSSSSTSSRNIESVISIPFAPPPRPRQSGQWPTATSLSHRSHPIPERSAGAPHASRPVASSPISISPGTHITARSLSMASSVPARSLPRPNSSFEPRVIRAGPELSRPADPPCLSPLSTSPTHARRSSNVFLRSTSAQRSSVSLAPSAPPASLSSFPRPSYLDHSALRHMLQTDPSTIIVPVRRVDPLAYTAAMSPPSDSDDESNASPPPPESIPTYTAIIAPEDRVFKLPTRWSEQERNSMLSVTADGRDLSYNGTAIGSDKDAAAARATHSIPPACGIYYYEVDILMKETKTHISIGFAGRSAKYSMRVGHDINSWGYHGNDGYVFAGDKTGMPYNQPFGVGDIVGCGIDFTTHKMFFTKNGTYLGPVFENVGKDTELYPSISLQQHGETIRVNFGQEPFKFDIDYHVQRQRNDTWNKIMGTPLDTSLLEGRIPSKDEKSPLSEEEVKAVTSKLVLSYLVHHGYAKTARAFEKQRSDLGQENVSNDEHADVDMGNPISAEKADLDDIESDIARRTGIVKSVIAGDVDSALSETQTHYPSVLEAEEGLVLFKLRCRKFIELILETNEIKKRMRAIAEPSIAVEERPSDPINGGGWMDEDGMDVDDDSTIMSPSSSNAFGTNGVETAVSPYGGDRRRNIAQDGWVDDTTSQYEAALKEAIVYGQTLQKEYEEDPRPEVQQMCKETFGIVAWKDPLKEGGPVVDIAGHTARVSLANALNQAILKSQGRPTLPALETLYRHTSTCVLELGMLGVGAAAFADMTKEFLDV